MPNRYNNGDAVYYYDPDIVVSATLANLRLRRGPADQSGAVAIMFGLSAAFDQAVKIYVWDKDSSTADNGTSVIKPTAVTGNGRWRSP